MCDFSGCGYSTSYAFAFKNHMLIHEQDPEKQYPFACAFPGCDFRRRFRRQIRALIFGETTQRATKPPRNPPFHAMAQHATTQQQNTQWRNTQRRNNKTRNGATAKLAMAQHAMVKYAMAQQQNTQRRNTKTRNGAAAKHATAQQQNTYIR